MASHKDYRDPFKPGELPEAALRIVKRLPDRARFAYTEYKMQYRVECSECGRLRDMVHYSIVERILRNRRRCPACQLASVPIRENLRRKAARAAGQEPVAEEEKPLSFDYHLWVTPPWPVVPASKASDER